MKTFENEGDFIKWAQSLKDLNLKANAVCEDIKGRTGSSDFDFRGVADDREASEEFAKNAMIARATDRILRHVFNGVIASIDIQDMTIRQNQVLNAAFNRSYWDKPLEDKQGCIRRGITQRGLPGNYAGGPFYVYNNGNVNLFWLDDSSLFGKCLQSEKSMDDVEYSVFLPELLGMEADRGAILKKMRDFDAGKFPVELSKEGKEALFDTLDNPSLIGSWSHIKIDDEVKNRQDSNSASYGSK